jgi:molecular chaperone Hsp33
MKEQDKLRRFVFEDLGIRGEWVKLDKSWQAAKEHQIGPDSVVEQLGQALAAVVMMSATIKFKGSIILQAQGKGDVKVLVAQSTEQRDIRGMIRSQEDVAPGSLQAMFGEGYLVLTIKTENAEPYQGIVPLVGLNLAEALEGYFNQSEQLNTRLWLAANDKFAAGLLLQELPAERNDDEDWTRLSALGDTLTTNELLNLDSEELLHRLFNQEKVRVFDSESVAFNCSCSRQKIEAVLQPMERIELDNIIAEQGLIEVDCEFCGRNYQFDKIDIEQLFISFTGHNSETQH